MTCVSASATARSECDGADEKACAPLDEEKPTALKKSAADVIDGYYKRRYIMFKEMYEHGNASR